MRSPFAHLDAPTPYRTPSPPATSGIYSVPAADVLAAGAQYRRQLRINHALGALFAGVGAALVLIPAIALGAIVGVVLACKAGAEAGHWLVWRVQARRWRAARDAPQ